MMLQLQAASGRRNRRVPTERERALLWVLAERPLLDKHNQPYYRVVIDVDCEVCWPAWRQCWADTVELLSPSRYPVRVLRVTAASVARADHARQVCTHCARVFRHSGHRTTHERVCGYERPRTLAGRRYEARAMAASILLLVMLATPAAAWRSGGALPPPDWAMRCWSDGVHTALHDDGHWQDRTVEGFVWGLTCDLTRCTGADNLRHPQQYPLNRCLPMVVTDRSHGEPAPPLGYPVRFVQPGWEGL